MINVLVASFLTLALTASAQTPGAGRKVYDPSADATADIARAVAEARRDHKRILLVFGGNWCSDCLVLDARFHEAAARTIIDANYLVVHIAVGEGDKNMDVAEKYRIPVNKGVPAIAVLESDGTLIFSQRNGEFESARSVDPGTLVEFLNRWKPSGAGHSR